MVWRVAVVEAAENMGVEEMAEEHPVVVVDFLEIRLARVVEVAAVAGKVEAKVVVEKVDAKVEAVAAVRTEREVKAAGG